MSQAPSMPMFWDAYIGDTTHLTTEEHGAYLLLLGAMWRRNGYVPNDDRDLARIVGLTSGRWRKTKARLSSLLVIEADTITQKNLLKIWKITQEKIETNRENGKRGGRPKANMANDLTKANGSVSRNPNDNRNETIPEPETDTEKKEAKASLPTDPEIATEAFEIYNDAARQSGWPSCQTVNKQRKAAMVQRLRECGGLDGWRVAIAKAQASSWCCGQNNRGWVANIDFLLQASSFAKLMEGNYDNRTGNANGSGRNGSSAHDKLMAGFAAVADREQRKAGLDLFPGEGPEFPGEPDSDSWQGGRLA